jgi:hypothetical protein
VTQAGSLQSGGWLCWQMRQSCCRAACHMQHQLSASREQPDTYCVLLMCARLAGACSMAGTHRGFVLAGLALLDRVLAGRFAAIALQLVFVVAVDGDGVAAPSSKQGRPWAPRIRYMLLQVAGAFIWDHFVVQMHHCHHAGSAPECGCCSVMQFSAELDGNPYLSSKVPR